MKLYFSLFIVLLLSTFVSCNNPKSDDSFEKIISELNNNNLNYFIRENPDNYGKMFWYNDLYRLDSLIKLEESSGALNAKNVSKIMNLISHTAVKTKIIDKYIKDSVLIYNCNTYAALLNLEYIIGNEFIKDYNYYLVRAPLAKITIDKDYTRSFGKVYLSVYDPNNNNFIVIKGDTIYSDNGDLSIMILPKIKT